METLNEVTIPQMDSVREELDLTCLTCRGTCRGRKLGMCERAGVLGGSPPFGLAQVLDFHWEVVRDEAWLLRSALSPLVRCKPRTSWPLAMLMALTRCSSFIIA